MRFDSDSPHVCLDEAVYNINENNVLESRFATGFDKETPETRFGNVSETKAIYDCSRIHPSPKPQYDKPSVFVWTLVHPGQCSSFLN